MLTIDKLSPETTRKIESIRWDRIIEKHEGPFKWGNELDTQPLRPEMAKHFPEYDPIAETPEFLEIGSYDVLLPVGRKHHPNITILHYFFGQDLSKMVIYLKDTTYDDDPFCSGFVAICEMIQPENFYIATLYHEWFIIDYDTHSPLNRD